MNKKSDFFKGIGASFANIGKTFVRGDWKTKVSFLVMGFGPIMRGCFVRGIALLACELAFIWYLVGFGWQYLSKLNHLGDVETHMDPDTFLTTYGDNSFLILLYGILSFILLLIFIFVWVLNVNENRKEEERIKSGRALPTNKEDIHSLIDNNFDKTLLALPVLGIFLFIVLPIIFMICVAFTNYDSNHQAPAKLFTWVGLQNFKELFTFGSNGFGSTFITILIWTLVWAFFATFLTYFGGMGIAILINKKGIKFKKLWRTILVMTIAIPQFVSLLYVSKMFAADGLVNSYLMKWGWVSAPVPFWTNALYARILIILLNLWVGCPYTMLICTGLLMNIPADLYESAKIDGANGWQTFRKITLPYMLFVTGPFLLTSFTGNLNNFNIIYLLSQGRPTSVELTGGAGYKDLLVTWLYKLTINSSNYRMAAVLGIMVFMVVAIVSLVVYGFLPSVRDEEGFQ